MKHLSIIVCLILLLVLGSPLLAAEPEIAVVSEYDIALQEVGGEIEVGNARWILAFRSQNAAKAAALFDKDGALLGDRGSITFGEKNILAAMKRWMEELGPAQVEFKRLNLWRLDSHAYEAGTYSYTWKDSISKEERVSNGHYLTIWKRQHDGSWLILRSIPLPE